MIEGPALRNLTAAIADACRSGLDPDALRNAVLPRLRRAVPIDALWWATVDPATLLFTQAHRDGLPEDIGPYFVQNELLADDANKWTDLARSRDGVRTLIEATAGDLERSARYRDIFRPLGLSDELRVALRTRGACWGYMCLHREGPDGFSAAEAGFVGQHRPVPCGGDPSRPARPGRGHGARGRTGSRPARGRRHARRQQRPGRCLARRASRPGSRSPPADRAVRGRRRAARG